MSRIRVFMGLILTLPLCACAPLVPPEQLVLPVTHARPNADIAVYHAWLGLTRAAQSGDVQGMAHFFTPDGMVIMAGGDTVRGREALAQFFDTERANPTADVLHFGQFSRSFNLQKCSDGANERGRFHGKRQAGGETSDTLSVRYAIRWQWDSLGGAEIQRITFVERSAIRRLGPSGCYIPLFVKQQSKRIAVILFGVASSARYRSRAVETAMRQEDWHGAGDLHLVCPSWTPCVYHNTPWTHLSTLGSHGLVLGIVRYRFSPSLATEVMVGDKPTGSTIGLDSAGTTQLEAMWSGSFVGAAVTYEGSGFQVGLGPAVDRTNWRLVRANPYNLNQRSEASGRVRLLGVIVDVGYHRAVIGPFRLDVRAQLRQFGKTALPGGATYLNGPVADNSRFIGVGVGTVF